MKKLTTKWFYLGYFLFNLVNTYLLMSGVVHPNLSNYRFEFSSFLVSLIGNLGVLSFFFVLSFIFFRKTKGRTIFLLVISFCLTFLCLALAIFTSIFSTFFKFTHLDALNNPATGNYILFYINYAIKLIIALPQLVQLFSFFGLVILFIFTDKSTNYYYYPNTKLAALFMSLVLIIIPFFNISSVTNNTIYQNSLNSLYGAHTIGVYDYYIYDLYDYIFPKKYTATAIDQAAVENFLNGYEQNSHVNPLDGNTYTTTNEYTGLLAGKNLLIIQLEATNDFIINLNVNGKEVTPNLNRLANNGLYFNNFFSTSGIGNTSDAEFAALSGLYGNGNDLTIFRYAGENYQTLAKDFTAKGYETFSLHGNTGDFYHRNTEHIRTLGFTTHYDLEYFSSLDNNLPLIHAYLSDEYFFTHLPTILETKNQYFAYAITLTTHSPFVPTPEIPTYDWGKMTDLGGSYLNFCHYLDYTLGLFLDIMAQKNLLDDLVIVLYGDHTSSIFPEDYDSIINTVATPVEYRRDLQNVPFIIYNENSLSSQQNDKVCGTGDVYRTLANLFGLTPKYYLGTDMMSNEPGFVYSPRNLDIWFDDGALLYPSGTVIGNSDYAKKVRAAFEHYKYHNDLILKMKYFN